MIRLAAVGDIHLGTESRGRLRPALSGIGDRADALLVAGDLTHVGTEEEAEVVAGELGGLGIPVIAVLGNHDHHSDQVDKVVAALATADITVLEGTNRVIETESGNLGVAGVKGFGSGFPPAMAADFGEPEMKDFVRTARHSADLLRSCLLDLDSDLKVALTHYSPSRDTLEGERPEIHPFLGSISLAEAIDEGGAQVAIHGHAHVGSRHGRTPGGTPVHNVALPLLDGAYEIIEVG